MSFSVSLHSEEEATTTTNLIKLKTSQGDGKPYLTLDLTKKTLTLKHSNISLKSQVNDTSSFYVKISQFYIQGKVIIIYTVETPCR